MGNDMPIRLATVRLLAVIVTAIAATGSVAIEPPLLPKPAEGTVRDQTLALNLVNHQPPSTPRLVRLPPVTTEGQQEALVAARRATPKRGTFRDEGQYLVINIHGQDYRLQRFDPQSDSSHTPEETRLHGSVHGRLSHRGRPLAGCEVALIRLKKTWAGYRVIPSDKPITTMTDSNGLYRFAALERGPYKLKWRPVGERSWIRRAEIRPDVHVRENESAEVKGIRVALRTIN